MTHDLLGVRTDQDVGQFRPVRPHDDQVGINTFGLGADRTMDAARLHVQADVAAILANRGEAIPPEALAAIEGSLRDIDRAIAEIHLALLDNPSHPSLGYMLAEAYQREAQLLEQLESWTRPVQAPAGDAPTTSTMRATEVLS